MRRLARALARTCAGLCVALACAGLLSAGACARDGRADTAARPPLPPLRPGIPLDLSYVDRTSPAFARFKRWVDLAVMGTPDYGFSAYDAALLQRLDPQPAYCTLAIRMTDTEVAAAEAAIAAGDAPEIAGDSYLEVGPRVAALSLTLDSCRARIDDAMRTRWSAYAEQAVWNVWHPLRAHWGARPHPWTGWATDNPGNNYHYSFLEATLYWALASGSVDWMHFLDDEKLPPLIAYLATLPGGGSREGTGYGAAHMRLLAFARLWRDATGENIAKTLARDDILYWTQATVPTLDRFAPIGDQSRVSVPELYDYHRRLVLEARALTDDPAAQALASWWLHAIVIDRMRSGFNTQYDLLPAGPADAPAPTARFPGLSHHATGVGQLFARTDWTRDALWLAFVAGPYDESHAHQEQGGFTLFGGDWLTAPENLWTHSGLQQGTGTHNVLRFERDAPLGRQCQGPGDDRVVHQCPGTTSTMTVVPGPDGALQVEADLTAAYGDDAPVRRWTRRLDFGGRRLRVEDRYETTPGTRAVFQVQVPVEPEIDGNVATAGGLRVTVLAPEGARLSALDWRTVDPEEFRGGWRLDIDGGTVGDGKTGTYVVEFERLPN